MCVGQRHALERTHTPPCEQRSAPLSPFYSHASPQPYRCRSTPATAVFTPPTRLLNLCARPAPQHLIAASYMSTRTITRRVHTYHEGSRFAHAHMTMLPLGRADEAHGGGVNPRVAVTEFGAFKWHYVKRSVEAHCTDVSGKQLRLMVSRPADEWCALRPRARRCPATCTPRAHTPHCRNARYYL
jgi:hypothetical protein